MGFAGSPSPFLLVGSSWSDHLIVEMEQKKKSAGVWGEGREVWRETNDTGLDAFQLTCTQGMMICFLLLQTTAFLTHPGVLCTEDSYFAERERVREGDQSSGGLRAIDDPLSISPLPFYYSVCLFSFSLFPVASAFVLGGFYPSLTFSCLDKGSSSLWEYPSPQFFLALLDTFGFLVFFDGRKRATPAVTR